MSEQRKKYTPTEKAKIALEAIKGEMTLAQISSKYGVHSTQINAWKKQLLAYLPDAFSEKTKQQTIAHNGEVAELYEQIGRLKVENDFLKKNVRCSVDNRCAWIEPDHPMLSVRQQAEILGINRSAIYYEPRPKVLSEAQLKLLRLVDEVYTKYPFMGSRQMSSFISSHHYSCKRHEARWAYEQLGLQSVAPGPHTSKPHPEHKIYPYLLKNLEIVRPFQVFSTDITYIRMQKGFVYLTVIIDWYSRFVLDWQLSVTMEADFCIETLGRVLASSHCEIFNTDQGSQFTSKGFIDLLTEHKIRISMDGKGRWVDNVFVERLWPSVKYECVYLFEWSNVLALRAALSEYFHFYNYERPHQSLNNLTPNMVHHEKILR